MNAVNRKNLQMLNEYLTHLRDMNRRPTSRYSVKRVTMRFLEFIGDEPLAGVTIEDLRGFVRMPTVKASGRRGPDVSQFPGMAPSDNTRKNRSVYLRGFFGWLYAEKKIPEDPSVRLKPPKVMERAPTPVEDEIWLRIWKADLTVVERAALGLAYFCGLRRYEVTGMQAPYVVRDRIVGFTRKGGSRAKPVPWLSCARMFLQSQPELIGHDIATFAEPLTQMCRAHPTGPMFVDWIPKRRTVAKLQRPEGFIDPGRFNEELALTLDRIGLHDVWLTPHDLRYSFGTKLDDFKVPIQRIADLMGHEDIATTKRYIKGRSDPLEDLLDIDEDLDVSPWM